MYRTLVLLALFIPAHAQSSQNSTGTIAREARKTLNELTTPSGPGAAILITRGNDILYRSARGRADIELNVPLSADNVFRIASITKTFTAALILKLAEAHRLSIDDHLSLFLPDFPNADIITIRELLNHTSGISDVVKDPQPGFSFRNIDTATHIAEIRKRPLDFPPGTAWRYSNAGFILLGAVIEKVTGQPWPTALSQQILDPLGLKQTLYGVTSSLIPKRATGYTTDNPTHTIQTVPYINLTTPASAGALLSTVDDLRIWMRALTSGRVISQQSFHQMIAPGPKLPGARTSYSYGLGMYLWHVRGALMIGHTGQIDGFTSALAYLPERDITIVVLANDDHFDARTAARRFAAIALGRPYINPPPRTLTAAELQSLTGVYRSTDGTLRTFSVRNNTLYTQRGTGNVIPLQATGGNQLHFIPDELSYFVPIRNVSESVTRLDYFEDGDGPPQPLSRN